MTKKYCIFLSALFCAFLGVFLVANAVSPDRTFSQMENRNLEQLPVPSVKTLLNGQFMKDFETYTTDQFVGRDGWIALKSTTERVLGKKENNNVYFAAGDTLISRFDEPDGEKVTNNLNYVNNFVENVDIPVTFSLIPTQACIWADRLPAGAPNASQTAILEQAKAFFNDTATTEIYTNLNTLSLHDALPICLGTAPMAHAAATSASPLVQASIGMLDTFIDTIIVCTMTGFAILVTGQWTSGLTGAAMTSAAFETSLPGIGGIAVTICLTFFAFTTALGWCVYGERCAIYFFGDKAQIPFRIVYCIAIPVGVLTQLDVVWLLADTCNALMAIPNLIAILLLSPVLFKLVKEDESKDSIFKH